MVGEGAGKPPRSTGVGSTNTLIPLARAAAITSSLAKEALLVPPFRQPLLGKALHQGASVPSTSEPRGRTGWGGRMGWGGRIGPEGSITLPGCAGSGAGPSLAGVRPVLAVGEGGSGF